MDHMGKNWHALLLPVKDPETCGIQRIARANTKEKEAS